MPDLPVAVAIMRELQARLAVRLRDTIVDVVTAAPSKPVHLRDIHAAVRQRVTFEPDDALHGYWADLLSRGGWRRPVAEALTRARHNDLLVEITQDAWTLPAPDAALRLDPSAAWHEVRSAARQALARRRPLESTQLAHRYLIDSVDETRLTVKRLDAHTRACVTAGEVERAIRYLNAAGGRVGRRTVHYTVAKEVAIVELHPRLAWSADRDSIEVVDAPAAPPIAPPTIEIRKPRYHDFGEAPDDDPAELALFARRVRRGQSGFRRRLLRLYGDRCAITGWGPAPVLAAAHVLLHSETGINKTWNGILLRSDLHELFDNGLLKIHPDSRTVVLHPSLRDTPYWELNGTRLRPRTNGQHPRRDCLEAHWQQPPQISP